MRCPLHSLAEDAPDSPAIISGDRRLAYADLEKLVHYAAINLKENGLERQSRIGLLGENSIEYAIVILAALRIGAIICPISSRWPQRAILEALNKIDCNVVIRMPESASVDFDKIDVIDVAGIVPNSMLQSVVYGQPVIQLDNPAAIIFTSGSTAIPKAALLSYGNLYFNALGANERIPFEANHRWLLSLPLYHVGGLGILFRAIIGGGAVVIPDKKESLVESINQYAVTHLSMVSTQVYRLLHDAGIAKLEKFPNILIGGGPVSETLLKQAQRLGFEIYTTYGLTEMASQVTTEKYTGEWHSGKLLNNRQLKIEDDGEILVQGKTLFLGYVENDEAVLHVDDDNWYHTGDIGQTDARGFLRVLGRKDNMIISGGENIFPEEIEFQLLQVRGITHALVVGVPDEEFGQRPAAFVDFYGSNRMDDAEIVRQLQKTLPKFKIPKIYLEWPEQLTDKSLKPIRAEFVSLAERFCREHIKPSPKVSS